MTQALKTFEFKKVLLLKLYVFPLIGVFVVAPIVIGTMLAVNDSLPVMMGACSIGFAVMFALFSYLSKDITISFDQKHICFNYEGKSIVYLKTDLLGFYSFNHFRDAISTVSMCFQFKDGNMIDLSDYLATGKFIRDKNDMLKQFLSAAQSELGFTDISVNKWRKFGKIGSTWYSRNEASLQTA